MTKPVGCDLKWVRSASFRIAGSIRVWPERVNVKTVATRILFQIQRCDYML